MCGICVCARARSLVTLSVPAPAALRTRRLGARTRTHQWVHVAKTLAALSVYYCLTCARARARICARFSCASVWLLHDQQHSPIRHRLLCYLLPLCRLCVAASRKHARTPYDCSSSIARMVCWLFGAPTRRVANTIPRDVNSKRPKRTLAPHASIVATVDSVRCKVARPLVGDDVRRQI